MPEPEENSAHSKRDSGTALTVAAFGDSLSAGFGLTNGDGFAPALQRELRRLGMSAEVVCASVSGDTSADGLARVEDALACSPDIVIVEFGYNDLYYGGTTAAVKDNLSRIIVRLQQAGARVLLAGTHAPANASPEERLRYAEMFRQLRDEHGVALYPFFMEGALLNPFLCLPGDDIHPNAEGARIIAKNIAPAVAAVAADV